MFKTALGELKEFFQKNTPESVLGAALFADAGGFFSGSLTGHDALIAAMVALVAFGFAEAGKDGQEVAAATTAATTPPAQPQPTVAQ